MFNAPNDEQPEQKTGQPEATPKVRKMNFYEKEADALGAALGLKTLDVEIRDGASITLREFEVADLAGLYQWLGELKANSEKLRGTKDGLNDEAKRQMLDMALSQGVDILNICSDGKIPKGARLPLSVAALLVEGMLEVNSDFFTAWPVIQGLMTDLGMMMGISGGTIKGEAEPLKGPLSPEDAGPKS